MGSAATTRRKRPKLCAVCLRRRRRPGLTTCATCGQRANSYSRTRYKEAHDAGRCTRSGCPERAEVNPATGEYTHLCPDHVTARRKRRS